MTNIGDTLRNGMIEGLLSIPQADLGDRAKVEAAVRDIAARQAAIAEAEIARRIDEARPLPIPPDSDTPYTRAARPTVIYVGLLFIAMIHVVIPAIAFFTNRPVGDINLPEEFWWTWGAVVTTWFVGRSYEKVNTPNTYSRLITGSR